MNEKGLQLVKNAEGFSEKPYICPAGKLTVGYGHTGNVSGVVTKDQAEELLKSDLKTAEQAVTKHVKVPLTENQFAALVSFVFNLGETRLANSTLLKLLNMGEYKMAANEFPKWVHAGGKILPGLVTRRQAEKELFLS